MKDFRSYRPNIRAAPRRVNTQRGAAEREGAGVGDGVRVSVSFEATGAHELKVVPG